MGVFVTDSVDVTIANLTIADTGGDGIFIGGGVPCRWPVPCVTYLTWVNARSPVWEHSGWTPTLAQQPS